MPGAISSSSAILVVLSQFQNSRKLLFLNNGSGNIPNPSLLYPIQDSSATPPTSISSSNSNSHDSSAGDSFDSNVIMVLSVLLCALICSLGLNSIIKCAFRCSTILSSSSFNNDGISTSAHVTRSSRLLANTGGGGGIKKKALKTFPTITYSILDHDLKLDSECVICLNDFFAGDKLRILPKCNHAFHVRCIDKWLNSHSSCPTCRQSLIQTYCQKVLVGATTASTVITITPPPPPPPPPLPPQMAQESTVVIRIAPLQHEAVVRNYQT